jgi:Secretion system C-terminal sorting domain
MKNILPILFLFISHFSDAQLFETAIDCGQNYITFKSLCITNDRTIITSTSGIINLDSSGNVMWIKEAEISCGTRIGANNYACYSNHDSITVWPGYTERSDFSVIDKNGIVLNTTTIPESLIVNIIHPTIDGGTISIAENQDLGSSSMILKSDSIGNFEWIKFIDSTNSELHLNDMIQTNDGGYFGIADCRIPNSVPVALFNLLIRLNSSGDTIWTKSIEQFSPHDRKIIKAPDNGFLILARDRFVLLDSNANIKWSKQFDIFSILLSDCVVSSDSNFVFSGTEWISPSSQPFLMKFDTAGTFQWMRKYPSPFTGYNSNLLIRTNDGGFMLTGNTDTLNTNTKFLSLIKTDSAGFSVCDSAGSSPVFISDTIETSPYNHPINVMDFMESPYLYDALILFDVPFRQTNYCISTNNPEITGNESEIQIYPNPSNGTFSIKGFQLDTKLNIDIFNSVGQSIFQTKHMNSQENLNSQFSPGLYYIKISDEKNNYVKKLIIE